MNESCQFVANDLVTQRQALRANSRKPGDLGPNPRCLLGASFNRHGGKTSDLIATLPAEAASRLSVLLRHGQHRPKLGGGGAAGAEHALSHLDARLADIDARYRDQLADLGLRPAAERAR